MSEKFCPHCGQSVDPKATFCSNCGKKVKVVQKTPARTEQFTVTEVIVSEMLANVRITPAGGNQVKVTIDGDEETKVSAKLQVSGSSLKISAPFPFAEGSSSPNMFGNSFVFTGGSGISSINGQIFVNGKAVDMDRKITIEVEVPTGTTIKVGKLVGKAKIGDTMGNLTVNIQGTTEVEAGKVKNLSVSISGSGAAQVAQVSGNIDAEISGSGVVAVDGGNANSFSASVSGSGSVTFNGTAQTADLGVSGSGNIYLAECLTAARKRKSGSGRVRVGKEPKSDQGFNDW